MDTVQTIARILELAKANGLLASSIRLGHDGSLNVRFSQMLPEPLKTARQRSAPDARDFLERAMADMARDGG